MRATLSHLAEKETCSDYRWQDSTFRFGTSTSRLRVVKTAARLGAPKTHESENPVAFFRLPRLRAVLGVEFSARNQTGVRVLDLTTLLSAIQTS